MSKVQKVIIIELLIILLLAVGIFFYSVKADLLEKSIEWLEQHEEYELDEVIPVSLFLMLAFAFFSYRRWRSAESLRREIQKKQTELEDALEDIEQLNTLLPICSSCKKIRDDKGYWHNVEKYISKHSKTEFSHSLCPECIMKLYPEHKEKL